MSIGLARTPLFETALLRRSVGALSAREECCHHCGRHPLVGEWVHIYGEPGRPELVCELCRPRRRQAPAQTRLVHSPEHERAVRIRRAA